jgi:hypothetical protein
MSDDERAAFRAALIIAVVGNFFSARVGCTQVDPDVLRAIAVLNDGTRVDWGQYAFDVVKDCADAVKRELFVVRRPSSLDLYGCSALPPVHSTHSFSLYSPYLSNYFFPLIMCL